MKNNEVLQKDVHGAIKQEHLSNAIEIGAVAKVGNHLKKIVYLSSLAGIGLLFTACEAGYVATEPTYTESARPPQPSNTHVWIDGGWVWSRQTHVYVRKDGYWNQPGQGRTFVAGHWQATARGHRWAPGHWEHNR